MIPQSKPCLKRSEDDYKLIPVKHKDKIVYAKVDIGNVSGLRILARWTAGEYT